LAKSDDVVYDAGSQDEPAQDVQAQVESQKEKQYGVIPGVFVPTTLTILGVIMFLRVGWVVGNAGLLGAWGIIFISFFITACTALSMSSFVTNTRVGAGGAFSIISQALGLEVGGAIGIPLYLSQSIAVAMYIFGFRAGWQWIFPDHPGILVDIGAFATMVIITAVSTSFAFRVQYFILLVVAASLVSVFATTFLYPLNNPIHWWGTFSGSPENDFQEISFWAVFAVFFPAATGIMAGANLSGELKAPRKSIPVGTMAAIGLTFVIYISLAYWMSRAATSQELVENYTVMIDKALWGPAVLAGLLAATFSSALATFVGAPRILQALGSHSIVPLGGWLARRTKKGEPLNAIATTSVLVVAAIMLRDLNILAPLITMTFLITYSMINLVVLVENKLQLISFRPTIKLPYFIPLIGFLGSTAAMFIINATFAFVALTLIFIIYSILMKHQLKSPFSDVRSGLFTAFAEWCAKQITMLNNSAERAWKPNILLPIDDITQLQNVFRIVEHIVKPTGSVKLLGMCSPDEAKVFKQQLEDESSAYIERGLFATSTVVEEKTFSSAVVKGLQALSSSFFKPNILCLRLPRIKSCTSNFGIF